MTDIALDDLTRPIVGIENRTAQEVFDIMCDRFRRTPSQVAPANPAQVTDAMVEALAEFLCSEFDEDFNPCHGYSWPEHKDDDGYRGGNAYVKLQPSDVQARAREGAARILTFLSRRAALTAAIGAGGQAVAEDTETLKARAASVLCEAGALCGWPAPNCNAREGAEALFKAGLLALSQPHPADERVVEALPLKDEVERVLDDEVWRELPLPDPTSHASTSPGPVNCSIRKRCQGEAYPRTCERCSLGPCPFFHGNGEAKRLPAAPSDQGGDCG